MLNVYLFLSYHSSTYTQLFYGMDDMNRLLFLFQDHQTNIIQKLLPMEEETLFDY